METDRDRRRQHDLSRANIVRAQVLFLCSTINQDNWEEKLEEFKKVSTYISLHALTCISLKKNLAWKHITLKYVGSLKSPLQGSFKDRMVHQITLVSYFDS